MCFSSLEKEAESYGLRTRLRAGTFSAASAMLAELLPYGKAAVLTDSDADPAAAERICAAFGRYRPMRVVLGRHDSFADLFSLPDDVRACIAFGERSAAAARFFCTLRGGYSVILPSAPSARGIFEEHAPRPWEGYPLREADIVVADGAVMRADPADAARTAFAALCAQELRIDAVFSGASPSRAEPFEEPARVAAAADVRTPQGRASLFCASGLFSLALLGMPKFSCLEGAELLRERAPESRNRCDYALLRYIAARSFSLFSEGEPRLWYVPDYAARLRAAAAYSRRPYAALHANVRVPSAEQSFRFSRAFEESRARLRTGAELLQSYAETFARGYYRAGGQTLFDRALLSEVYDVSAELSPLLGPPALEREFGLLPSRSAR